MKKIENHLKDRRKKLIKAISKCKKTLSKSPEGILRVTSSRGHPRYYWRQNKSDKKYKYIKKGNVAIARNLAQRDYYRLVLKRAEEELEVVERLITILATGLFETVFESLPTGRRSIVTPITLTNEEYARRWQEVKYEGKPFLPGDPDFRSLKGERMRSKSEVIIANLLYTLGIPYRYEYPIKLKNGKTIYPDFIILNVNTREEYIYEHMGMMGDENYAAKNVSKINELIESDYFPGENLLLTFESVDSPLDIQAVEIQLRHFMM